MGCEMLEPYDMKVSRTILKQGKRVTFAHLFGESGLPNFQFDYYLTNNL